MNPRRLVAASLRYMGYEGLPLLYSTRHETVLGRTLRLAGSIETVIDVGASDGRWSAYLMARHVPDANFLLFEAQPLHYAALTKFVADRPRAHVERAAASDHAGEVHFYADDSNPLGGGASTTSFAEHSIVVPSITVDEAITRHALPGPYLLKLDAQGHESEIFHGACGVLAKAALVIVEVYGIGEPGRPPFDEICSRLRTLGLAAAGIADVMTRPSDGALWQMDMHFLPTAHPCFADPKYH